MSAIGVAYEPIADDLGRVCRIIDDELFCDLPVVNDLCQQLNGYRGKMLRPALLLLSARACGQVAEEHFILSAVLEIVHMATLVHDDVLDEADLRRRRPTINRLRGNEAAVLLGDYLISHAFHLCSSVDAFACREIGATTNMVCEGELQQVHHRNDWNLSIEQYTDIISRKTAALTGTACMLGAHYAGASAEVVNALHLYGMEVGVAFQITDDVLDITGSQEQMGKSLGRDLAECKLTLPIIHALATSGAPFREGLLGQLQAAEPDRAKIAVLLEQTSSIPFAIEQAERHIASALGRLAVLPKSESRASLASLAGMVTSREV